MTLPSFIVKYLNISGLNFFILANVLGGGGGGGVVVVVGGGGGLAPFRQTLRSF